MKGAFRKLTYQTLAAKGLKMAFLLFHFQYLPVLMLRSLRSLKVFYLVMIPNFLIFLLQDSNMVRIGYLGIISPGTNRNNFSAQNYECDVSKAIFKELQRGYTAGPFPFTVLLLVQYQRRMGWCTLFLIYLLHVLLP